MTPISSMMKTQVWTVGMDDTVAEIEQFMNARGLSWVPVCEADGTVVGVVGASDLLQFHSRKGDPATTLAWNICSYKPLSVTPDTGVAEVARLMLHHKAHHVVVMDGARIVGVVSSLDFVRQFA
jgi:signal-transduction protein with cAMP-binding, CBS, and nucleotidyltransferase domain